MTDFIRVACDIACNVRVRRAGASLPPGCGADALLVYVAVLTEHKRCGQDGRIPAPHSDVDAFGFQLLALGVPLDRLTAALEAIIKAGLVERDADGGLKVVGWNDFWRTGMTSTQRSQRRRKRQKDASATAPPADVQRGGNGMQREQRGGNGMQHVSSRDSNPIQSNPSQVKTSQVHPPPSEGTGEDGPIADTLEQDLRARGIASRKHLMSAARNLREYDDPTAVLDLAQRHCQRFGDNVPALLATVLCDKQQIGVMLREASQKADNAEARSKIETMIARMRLRMLAGAGATSGRDQ